MSQIPSASRASSSSAPSTYGRVVYGKSVRKVQELIKVLGTVSDPGAARSWAERFCRTLVRLSLLVSGISADL
jgi:hypothetical protein